ncbi:unnamed protein product [Linum trigynum]|uniref:Uncharacterized protein n=1 Tax=Linum trigynum TaxID=586398 RepID=A0AAV2ERY3_9ROSI
MKLQHSITFLLLLAMAAAVPTSSSNSSPMGSTSSSGGPRHFVLVHGAWSWYKMLPLLTSASHNATAIELAASGVDPQQVGAARNISQYTQPLMDYLSALPPTEKWFSSPIATVGSRWLKPWKFSPLEFLWWFSLQPSCQARPTLPLPFSARSKAS